MTAEGLQSTGQLPVAGQQMLPPSQRGSLRPTQPTAGLSGAGRGCMREADNFTPYGAIFIFLVQPGPGGDGGHIPFRVVS